MFLFYLDFLRIFFPFFGFRKPWPKRRKSGDGFFFLFFFPTSIEEFDALGTRVCVCVCVCECVSV